MTNQVKVVSGSWNLNGDHLKVINFEKWLNQLPLEELYVLSF